MDDRYDEAIAWLGQKDRMKGSYYEEGACLMEELLGRIYELEMSPPKRRRKAPPAPVKPRLRLVPGSAERSHHLPRPPGGHAGGGAQTTLLAPPLAWAAVDTSVKV